MELSTSGQPVFDIGHLGVDTPPHQPNYQQIDFLALNLYSIPVNKFELPYHQVPADRIT